MPWCVSVLETGGGQRCEEGRGLLQRLAWARQVKDREEGPKHRLRVAEMQRAGDC